MYLVNEVIDGGAETDRQGSLVDDLCSRLAQHVDTHYTPTPLLGHHLNESLGLADCRCPGDLTHLYDAALAGDAASLGVLIGKTDGGYLWIGKDGPGN